MNEFAVALLAIIIYGFGIGTGCAIVDADLTPKERKLAIWSSMLVIALAILTVLAVVE